MDAIVVEIARRADLEYRARRWSPRELDRALTDS